MNLNFSPEEFCSLYSLILVVETRGGPYAKPDNNYPPLILSPPEGLKPAHFPGWPPGSGFFFCLLEEDTPPQETSSNSSSLPPQLVATCPSLSFHHCWLQLGGQNQALIARTPQCPSLNPDSNSVSILAFSSMPHPVWGAFVSCFTSTVASASAAPPSPSPEGLL